MKKGYKTITHYGLRFNYRIPPHVFTEAVKTNNIALLEILHTKNIPREIGMVQYAICDGAAHLDVIIWLKTHGYIRDCDWVIPERLWVSHLLGSPVSHRNYPITQDIYSGNIPNYWIPSDAAYPLLPSLYFTITARENGVCLLTE